jgi:acyl-ACP thioesterase
MTITETVMDILAQPIFGHSSREEQGKIRQLEQIVLILAQQIDSLQPKTKVDIEALFEEMADEWLVDETDIRVMSLEAFKKAVTKLFSDEK